MKTIIRALLTGTAAAAAGTLPWAALTAANLKFFPNLPWAVPVMALILALLWRVAPRAELRANRISGDVWAAALFAGFLGLWALVLLFSIVNRLVRLPAQQIGDISKVPLVTVIPVFLMGCVVAGLVEEAAFRGYMQGPIERRYGPVVAILLTGTLFGFAHFTHPETTLILMPYYVAVAAIYGTLAWLTNSIWPSVVLHAVGNMFGALDYFARGQSEWQASANAPALIWETGMDASMWISCVAFVLVGAAAVWAYSTLADVARITPAQSTSQDSSAARPHQRV